METNFLDNLKKRILDQSNQLLEQQTYQNQDFIDKKRKKKKKRRKLKLEDYEKYQKNSNLVSTYNMIADQEIKSKIQGDQKIQSFYEMNKRMLENLQKAQQLNITCQLKKPSSESPLEGQQNSKHIIKFNCQKSKSDYNSTLIENSQPKDHNNQQNNLNQKQQLENQDSQLMRQQNSNRILNPNNINSFNNFYSNQISPLDQTYQKNKCFVGKRENCFQINNKETNFILNITLKNKTNNETLINQRQSLKFNRINTPEMNKNKIKNSNYFLEKENQQNSENNFKFKQEQPLVNINNFPPQVDKNINQSETQEKQQQQPQQQKQLQQPQQQQQQYPSNLFRIQKNQQKKNSELINSNTSQIEMRNSFSNDQKNSTFQTGFYKPKNQNKPTNQIISQENIYARPQSQPNVSTIQQQNYNNLNIKQIYYKQNNFIQNGNQIITIKQRNPANESQKQNQTKNNENNNQKEHDNQNINSQNFQQQQTNLKKEYNYQTPRKNRSKTTFYLPASVNQNNVEKNEKQSNEKPIQSRYESLMQKLSLEPQIKDIKSMIKQYQRTKLRTAQGFRQLNKQVRFQEEDEIENKF